jgi:hypothetical protein
MSYIILRDHWFHIIVLNVHAPTKDKIDGENSYYEELERICDRFPKYRMKILLGDFSAKIGREGIFKLTVGNDSLHKISNNNVVREIHFATSENLNVKSTMFPHPSIHKYTVHLEMGNPTIRLTIF